MGRENRVLLTISLHGVRPVPTKPFNGHLKEFPSEEEEEDDEEDGRKTKNQPKDTI